MVRKAVIWGAKGHGKVLHECLALQGIEVVAFFDNDPQVRPPTPDVPLLIGQSGFEKWLEGTERADDFGFSVAVGGNRGVVRLEIQDYLAGLGLTPLVVAHPSANVSSSAQVGLGSHILAGATVSVECELGEACIVNTGATIDHECRLAAGVHIAPGAHVAGCVSIGRCAMIGIGAVVLPRLNIGEGAVVGAGAVVIEDVPSGMTVVGNPACELGRKEHGG